MNKDKIVHELKTWKPYFEHVRYNWKNFEVRKNYRNFKKGDELILLEWDQNKEKYTGNKCYKEISYILEGGSFGIEKGYCVLGLISKLK